MANKSKKAVAKVALASTIAAATVAGVVYTSPKIIKTVADEDTSNSKFRLKSESIDRDTVKVYIDNVEDIPKSFQFSIQLEGVIPKFKDGNLSIKDLIKEKNPNAITTYSYNSSSNTIDVIVTSTDGIEKKVNGNYNTNEASTEIIEIFELDVEKSSDNKGKEYKVLAPQNTEYKYLTTDNKQVEDVFVDDSEQLLINSAPKVTKKENLTYIELNIGEKITLTDEKLKDYITVNDEDDDNVTLKVVDKDGINYIGKEFGKSKVGIYDLYVTANDGLVDSEKLTLQVKVTDNKQKPVITKDGQELKDLVIKPGQFETLDELYAYLKDGVEAVDSNNNKLDVNVEIVGDVDLNSTETKSYIVIYSAGSTIKEIALTIREEVVTITKNGEDLKDIVIKSGDFKTLDELLAHLKDGVEAVDNSNNKLDVNVEIVGEVDLNPTEDKNYTVKYSAGSAIKEITLTIQKEENANNPGGGSEGEDGNPSNPGGGSEGEDGNPSNPGGGSEGEDGNPSNPEDGNDIIEVPGFIEDIIVSEVVSKGEGNGSLESPLQLEVKDVTLDSFETFLTKLKGLNPVIVDKYVEGNYTIYKIKVEDTSILSKVMRLFRSASSDEGYIYLKVANNLEASSEIMNAIETSIKLDEDNGNQDGNGGAITPDDGNGSQGGTDGSKPDGGSGNEGGTDSSKPETGNGGTSTPDGNNGNQGSTEETITPDKNESEDKKEESNGIKLPITGQESILGYVATAVIAIGGVLFFYKKKK